MGDRTRRTGQGGQDKEDRKRRTGQGEDRIGRGHDRKRTGQGKDRTGKG